MYNAHGQDEKYGKSYEAGKRANYGHESSDSYNRRVKRNALLIGAVLVVVLCIVAGALTGIL